MNIQSSFYKGMYIEQRINNPENPTLVFLHDSLGCVELWRDFPDRLAKALDYNILVYDRLGYGRSAAMPSHLRAVSYMEAEARILSDMLHQYRITNTILFGHSDGGTIALLTAALFPESIKALIVEAAHIFVEPVTLAGIEAAIRAYETTNLPERLAKYHGDKTTTLFKAWTLTWTRADYRQWNIEDQLPHIKAPLLFIQGTDDEYGSLEQVTQTINKPKGIVEKLILENTGHTPHKESPDLVLENCISFISKLPIH